MTTTDGKRVHTLAWEHENKMMSVLLELSGKATILRQGEVVSNGKKVKPKETNAAGKKSCCGKTENKSKNKTIGTMLRGGAKLLKSELGIDASSSETVNMRKKICESCEHYDFGVCESCGCFCASKVKINGENCPEGKW